MTTDKPSDPPWWAKFLIIVFALSLAAGGWFLERSLHYRWSYESRVKQTIRQTVKPECLR